MPLIRQDEPYAAFLRITDLCKLWITFAMITIENILSAEKSEDGYDSALSEMQLKSIRIIILLFNAENYKHIGKTNFKITSF